MNGIETRAPRAFVALLCVAGLAAVLFHGHSVARRDAIARAAADVEHLLLRELEVEARRLGATTDAPAAQSILRARARYEAGLFGRAVVDDMDYLDPVVEARLLELLALELDGSRPTSVQLQARAREIGLLANDPVIRRRLINKRMLQEG